MSAKGLLGKLLLVSATMLFMVNCATASDVKLAFNGVQGAVNGNAGLYKWTVTDSLTSSYSSGNIINTFCISSTTYLNNPDIFTLRDDIENMPTPAGGMGPAKATKLAILINEVFGSGSKSSFDNNSAANGWAAVQYAVWNIIGLGLPSTPSPTLAATIATLVGDINTIYSSFSGTDPVRLGNYYSSLGINNPNHVYIHGLDALGVGSQLGQDQMYWTSTPNFVIQAPVPAGAVMAGMGILCLGGLSFMRRRKQVAAV